MSDAHRRHCADSEAEALSDNFDAWNDAVDIERCRHRIVPTAFSRPERFAAWQDDIGPAGAADSFAHTYYDGDGGCDDIEDYYGDAI